MYQLSPFYALIIGLEIILSNYQHRKVYTWKETITNFYLSFVNAAIDLLIRGVYLVILTYCYQLHFFTIENPVLYWTALLVLLDLQFYWLHRLEHFCRVFWAVHVTHHSSEMMNTTVSFRASVFQPLYRFVFFIPLALLGFQPFDILLMYSLTQFWSLFVHTEFIGKLGWMEELFVTPSHHRVHHASNIKYLDKNLGTMFIIWDRLFGTFQRELSASEYEPIRYGLTKPLEKQTPLTIIFHEWINIIGDLKRKDIHWKEKTGYLFRPPGWSHDGSRLTSDQLREKELEKEMQTVRRVRMYRKNSNDYLPVSSSLSRT